MADVRITQYPLKSIVSDNDIFLIADSNDIDVNGFPKYKKVRAKDLPSIVNTAESITYANLIASIAANDLIIGTFYKITDSNSGVSPILVQAIGINSIGYLAFDAANPLVTINYDVITDTIRWSVNQNAAPISLGSLSAITPLTYDDTTGVFTISQSSSTTDGYLSSDDWEIFNNKQGALNGTGIVKSTSGTISYLTDNTANWNTAYNDKINSAAVTGVGTNTLTLTQQDAGTITATWVNGTLIREIRNNTGATLTKGTIVYINGATGNKPTVSKAIATGDSTSAQTFGFVQDNISNNANGYVVVVGDLTGIDTSDFTEGAQLYLSSTVAGTFTSTKQYAPAHLVYVGIVTRSHPNLGQIEVNIQNGYEMDELHNVSAQSPSNGDILQFVTSTGLWTKVAGTTSNISEGSNLYFTEARVNNNTNVAANTAARHNAVTLGNPNGLSLSTQELSLGLSSASATGALSSTDWTTFNNKQAAGNYITALTGEATASGPGSSSVTLTNSAVVGKVLTGLNVTGGSVSATDSVLTAFGKVQNQINGLIGGSIYQGVWNASTNSPALASSVGTKGYYYIVNVAGSTNLDGITDWKVGDWAIYDGSAWQKVDNTDAVSSVNGFTGAVSLTTSNITEGTNLYFTDARARAAISLTTTGTSGAATYSSGVLNIPQYQAALTNPVTGTGTTNYLPKFTGTSALGNSIVSESSDILNIGGRLSATGSDVHSLIVSEGSAQLKLERTTSNAGLMYLGADNVGFKIFNSDFATRLTLTSSGNLGLGVTPSNAYVDSKSFEIGSNGVLWSENASSIYNSMTIGLNFYYNSAGNALYKNTGIAASRYTQYQGSHIWTTAPSGTAGDAITFTQAMTLAASGNLLIGTSTDAGYKLNVNGTGRFSGEITSTTGNNTRLFTTSGATTGYLYADIVNTGGRLIIGVESSTGATMGSGYDAYASVIASNTSANLNFGTNGTKRLSLDGSSGAATFSSSITATRFKTSGFVEPTSVVGLFNNTNYGGPAWNNASLVTGNGATGVMFGGDTGAYSYGWMQSVQTDNGGVKNLSLQPLGGNVGIGTTSPANGKLVVKDSGYQYIAEPSDSATYGYLGIGHFTSGTFIGTTAGSNAASDILRFGTSATERMRITSGGELLIGTQSALLFGSGRGVLEINGSTSSIIDLKVGDALGSYLYSTNSSTELYSTNDLSFSVSGVERMRITSAGNVGIGTTSPTASAKVQIDSSTQGFLVPRMGDGEINSISSPAAGLMVYNTDINHMCMFDGSVWKKFSMSNE